MQKEKSNIESILEGAITNLAQIIEVKKIVGEPILNEKGQSATPVAKLTICTFCGGGEYGDVKVIKQSGENFAGGMVTFSSVTPECFLIDNGNGFAVINEKGEGLESFLKSLAKIIGDIKL